MLDPKPYMLDDSSESEHQPGEDGPNGGPVAGRASVRGALPARKAAALPCAPCLARPALRALPCAPLIAPRPRVTGVLVGLVASPKGQEALDLAASMSGGELSRQA